MSSRDSILRAVRENRPDEVEAPEIPRFGAGLVKAPARPGSEIETSPQPIDDLIARFKSALQGVGGSWEECPAAGSETSVANQTEILKEIIRRYHPHLRNIVSAPDCPTPSTMDVSADETPASLVELELAVVRGRLGVAENGAVWVDGESLPHPALPFVAEHLVLLLRKGDLVADMHDAYRALAGRGLADEVTAGPGDWPAYGVFISGPSKTADIEQSLVMGAQGPRTALVVLIG